MNSTSNMKRNLSLFALIILMSSSALAIESPKYTVVYKDASLEYRQYEPYIVAETVVQNSSSYKRASNEGFMRLFRYITGDNNIQMDIEMTAPVQRNAVSEDIAMTAPVQRVETEQGWRIAFMLPEKFSMETAPLPTDERINLRPVAGQLMAVVRYSGRWTERNFEKHKEKLLTGIEAHAIEATGVIESAAYDAPYVLPFLRRNEVMIPVDSAPELQLSVAAGS